MRHATHTLRSRSRFSLLLASRSWLWLLAAAAAPGFWVLAFGFWHVYVHSRTTHYALLHRVGAGGLLSSGHSLLPGH
jgi:hypothetical protein